MGGKTQKSARIGTLEVRTVGTGSNRVKVVKLPGHEFPIEHFLPSNLDEVRKVNERIRVVRSTKTFPNTRKLPKFFAKRSTPNRWQSYLDILSEARLARHLNEQNIESVRFEEPLAAILHQNGHHEVLYRPIQRGRKNFTEEQLNILDALDIKLARQGIEALDLAMHNVFPGKGNVVHVFDLEGYKLSENLKQKLGIRRLFRK